MGDLRRAIVHTDHIVYNIQHIRRACPTQHIIFAVKADAYGHGVSQVVDAVDAYVQGYWVCDIEEAIQVRQRTQKIIILNQYLIDPNEVHDWLEYDFAIAVTHPDQIEALCAFPPSKPLNIWLKINTGMNRMGVSPSSFSTCFERLLEAFWVRNIVLMTHLADPTNTPENQKQIRLFRSLCGDYPQTSYANSGAILTQTDHRLNEYIRPGIMGYGVSPFPDRTATELGLKSAMVVQARIVSINTISAGGTVGYGRLHRVSKPSRVAVVAMGYADGFPRAPIGAFVKCRGQLFVVVGRASMDTFTIDVTQSTEEVRIGDWVTVWGEDAPIELLSAKAMTSPYVLLTHLGNRVRKYYEVRQSKELA